MNKRREHQTGMRSEYDFSKGERGKYASRYVEDTDNMLPNPDMPVDLSHPKFPLVPGIVGGFGPFAHVGFEKRLLDLTAKRFGAAGDSDFPEWIVSSVPQVPVRFEALAGKAPDPLPYLLKSLRRLHRAGADFAAITCNTAHAFLPAIAEQVPLPIVHVVLETVEFVLSRLPTVQRAGLLATTGTCRCGIFTRAFADRGVELIWPRDGEDLRDLSNLQERLVMQAIYGPEQAGQRSGGIKAGLIDQGEPSPRDLLREAARGLVEQRQVQAVIVACSEISLAIGPDDAAVPIVDTMDVLAGAVLDLASAKRPLDSLPQPSAWPRPTT